MLDRPREAPMARSLRHERQGRDRVVQDHRVVLRSGGAIRI